MVRKTKAERQADENRARIVRHLETSGVIDSMIAFAEKHDDWREQIDAHNYGERLGKIPRDCTGVVRQIRNNITANVMEEWPNLATLSRFVRIAICFDGDAFRQPGPCAEIASLLRQMAERFEAETDLELIPQWYGTWRDANGNACANVDIETTEANGQNLGRIASSGTGGIVDGLVAALETLLFGVTEDVSNNNGRVDLPALEDTARAALAAAKGGDR